VTVRAFQVCQIRQLHCLVPIHSSIQPSCMHPFNRPSIHSSYPMSISAVIHHSAYPTSIHPIKHPIYQCTNSSIQISGASTSYPAIPLHTYLQVYPSILFPVRPSIHPFIHPPIHILCIRLCICPFIRPSAHFLIHFFTLLFVLF
jgi:hypothetical protein